MEAPAKCDASDVLYWSRGRLGGWQLGCVCAVGISVVRKNILYTVQKVKGGVHFHQHVLQSDDMAGEVRSGLLSSRHRLEPKKAVESRSR